MKTPNSKTKMKRCDETSCASSSSSSGASPVSFSENRNVVMKKRKCTPEDGIQSSTTATVKNNVIQLQDLGDDLLGHITKLVCPNSYCIIGALNKRFHAFYLRQKFPKTTSLHYMLNSRIIAKLHRTNRCDALFFGLARSIVDDNHIALKMWCLDNARSNRSGYGRSNPYTMICMVLKQAAKKGRLNILQEFRFGIKWQISWWYTIMQEASAHGHLHILEWVSEKKIPWREKSSIICEQAASNGHLHILKWTRMKGCYKLDDEWTCASAALHGHQEILQWLIEENGCSVDETCCAQAAKGNNLHILKWAYENGLPWNSRTCAEAASTGNLDLLRWLRSKGCPWDENTCAQAAKGNNLHILQWAVENGCRWNERTCAEAASTGNLDLLKWARRNGCPWNKTTCESAALFGHLHILSWVRQEECSWDYHTCRYAVRNGNFQVIRWLKDNGCPMD